MSCHAECQAVRTVEIRSPGGRDGPQRRLVMEVRREGFEGGGGGFWFRDILVALTWHEVASLGLERLVDFLGGGGMGRRWGMRREVLGILVGSFGSPGEWR